MVLENAKVLPEMQSHIIVTGQAERLDCKYCGREYISRGLHDPGYCRECEARLKAENAPLVGGPLGSN